jgi:hypothetical protein
VPPEYKTLRFPRTRSGWRNKDTTVNQMAAQGWRVASESIAQGKPKGDTACCLGSLCLPMGFLAGQTPGIIVVTLVRDSAASVVNAIPQGPPRLCAKCGRYSEPEANFCRSCGARIE